MLAKSYTYAFQMIKCQVNFVLAASHINIHNIVYGIVVSVWEWEWYKLIILIKHFERYVDHLEFIQLMDQQVFLGLKLKVMPFGFTNVDRQESLSKLQLWQDSACMLFNTQWYPKEESNNTSTNKTAWNILAYFQFEILYFRFLN